MATPASFRRWSVFSALAVLTMGFALAGGTFAQEQAAPVAKNYNLYARFAYPTKGYTFAWWTYVDTAPSVLHWRFAADLGDLADNMQDALYALHDINLANGVGDANQRVSLSIARALGPGLFSGERKQVDHITGGALIAYRVAEMPGDDQGLRDLFDFAKESKVETIITQGVPANMGLVGSMAQSYGVSVAICGPYGAMVAALDRANISEDPSYNYAGAGAGQLSRRVGACLSQGALAKEGVSARTAIERLKKHISIVELSADGAPNSSCNTQCFLDSLYENGVKPSLIVMRAPGAGTAVVAKLRGDLDRLEPILRPFVAHEALMKSQGKADGDAGPGLAEQKAQAAAFTAGNSLDWDPVTPDRKAVIDAALPNKAMVKPKQPRKLLVLTLNLGYPGHASIPTHSYAIEELGRRTGAYQAVFDNNLDNLKYPAIKRYDAIFLNNTVGLIFADPAVREGLLRFVREGGGLGGIHASSHASLDWPEFQEMLGAYPGDHQEPTEETWLKVEDPANPINAAFHGKAYLRQDEIFRVMLPYDRSKLHVLLSIDTVQTDMSQFSEGNRKFFHVASEGELRMPDMLGRQDNDYAVSWIKPYGKGRVFYTTMGHVPTLFMDPPIARHMLGGLQYILGDLKVDDSPLHSANAR